MNFVRNVLDFVDDLLKEAMNSLNLDKIIAAMLLGRQGCLEGPHVFMIYQDWFQVIRQT